MFNFWLSAPFPPLVEISEKTKHVEDLAAVRLGGLAPARPNTRGRNYIRTSVNFRTFYWNDRP